MARKPLAAVSLNQTQTNALITALKPAAAVEKAAPVPDERLTEMQSAAEPVEEALPRADVENMIRVGFEKMMRPQGRRYAQPLAIGQNCTDPDSHSECDEAFHMNLSLMCFLPRRSQERAGANRIQPPRAHPASTADTAS